MCNRFSQILLNLCCSKGPLLKRIMHQGYFISNPFSVINLFDPGYEGNREKSQDSHFWTHNKLKSVRIRSSSGIHFWIDLLHICTCWNTKVMDISGIYRNPIKILPFGPIQTLTGKGELQVRKPSLVEWSKNKFSKAQIHIWSFLEVAQGIYNQIHKCRPNDQGKFSMK